jgi:hypothetical protein
VTPGLVSGSFQFKGMGIGDRGYETRNGERTLGNPQLSFDGGCDKGKELSFPRCSFAQSPAPYPLSRNPFL